MEETGNTQERMETSSEGGQGPEGAVAPWKKKKKKEDVGTSEEDDIDSQDSNTPIDHGHLARNCSMSRGNMNIIAIILTI